MFLQQYLNLCQHVLDTGRNKDDRTGTGTVSVFGYQMRFDLSKGFPILTTKKVPFHLIVSELLWFIKGDSNIQYLLQHKNNIWNEWAFKKWVESDEYEGVDMTNFGHRAQEDPTFAKIYEETMEKFKNKILTDEEFAKKYGELGPVYGRQWRSWEGANGRTFDQLKWVIEEIKRNPNSRRLIVSAWNPEYIIPDTEGNLSDEVMALPPCHTLFQFYVKDGKLSCQLYQRSADIFLGVPFNISSYALLTHLVAHVTGLKVGEFIHTLGDAHIYSNHFEQIQLQLTRTPYELPTLKLNPDIKNIEDFTIDDINLENYESHPAIKGAVAV